MQCPKCGHVQDDAPECKRCGIIIVKYKAPKVPVTPPEALPSNAMHGRTFPLKVRPSWMASGVVALFAIAIFFHRTFFPIAFSSSICMGLAMCAGWLRASRQAPWNGWRMRPWRVFWLCYLVVFVGLILLGQGMPWMGILFLVVGGLPMVISTILGLCVTWQRSPRRGLLILGGFVLISALASIRDSSGESSLARFDFALFTSLLTACAIVLMTGVAESFSQQLTSGREPSKESETLNTEGGSSR